MWKPKGKPAWNRLVKNIEYLDPAKVVVVLVGTDDFWASRLKSKPPNKEFFTSVKELLQLKGLRFAEITDFMEDLKYGDSMGHPAPQGHQKLAQKLLETFQDLDVTQQRPCARPSSSRARREAPASEAVRSAPGAAAEAVVQSGSRADVLDTEGPYDGWEQDLRSQHSVISKPISDSKKNKQSFQCELCDVWLPSWSQVQGHCRGAQHKKKKAALGTKCVPASSVDSSL